MIVDVYNWMDILGWTLIHSLWQGFIIMLLFLWVRRIFPSAAPSVKYAISTGALLLTLLSFAGTFIYLLPGTLAEVLARNERSAIEWTAFPSAGWSIDPSAGLQAFTWWVNDHLLVLIIGWLTGMLFFSFRLVAAWTHTIRLRIRAERVVGFWESKLQELARDLGIRRIILLAESNRVDAPVLLGYLKPIILVPVGMISGLSPDQVETILLHELAHIRRHDFAINFAQSVIEVIFFFNPFIWIISSHIRSDREQCCDDLVVQIKNPLIYAQALHHLAAAQTLGTSLSLGVAGSKNILLQRIKRIMKTSEKKEESRGKVIPAMLVMMALAAASWLSIQAYLPESTNTAVALLKEAGARPIVPIPVAIGTIGIDGGIADTLKKDLQEQKSSTYSRQTITTYDEKGKPHTEIIENSEGDADVEPFVIVPDVDLVLPIPPIAPIPELAELDAMNFNLAILDTLPRPGLWQEGPDREVWEKEFTEKFREQFSDFYAKNRPEFEKIMKELDENLKKLHENFDPNLALTFDSKREWKMREMEEKLQRLAPPQEEMMRAQEEQMKKMHQDMRHQEEMLEFKMKEQEGHMKSMERKMKSFEKELTEQLVKDGYLGKEDKINSINWEKDGSIKVNGKKIKDADQQKYNDLHKKYFKEGARFGLVE